jgi:sugar-specific transcriptional regulator TrmB
MFSKRQLFESFKKLDLTEYETEAYLTLLSHGPLSPSRLSSASKIPRPRVYDVLKGLTSSGIVLEKPGKPTTYSPVEIDKVISILESKAKDEFERRLSLIREQGKSLIKELKDQKPKRIDRVFVFNNTINIINWFRVSAMEAKDYINILSSFDRGILPRSFRNYLEFAKKMRSKNIKVRYCLPIERWNAEEIEKLSKFIQVKHLLKIPEIGIYIIDGKEAMIMTSTYPKATYDNGILIKDQAITKIIEDHFNRTWEEDSIPLDLRLKELS